MNSLENNININYMSKKLGGTAIKMRKERFVLDSYFTPPYATHKLLEMESFDGKILEPASGHGHISKILEEKGYDVTSSDFRDDAYGASKIDFFDIKEKVDNIVTNPPYSLAPEFIEHGLSLINNKMVLLLRLAFIESESRHILMTTTPLKSILAFSKRLDHWNGTKWIRSGQFSHAWFVWDKTVKPNNVSIKWLM